MFLVFSCTSRRTLAQWSDHALESLGECPAADIGELGDLLEEGSTLQTMG